METNHQLPKEYRISKKEEEEISEKLTTRVREMSKNYLKGLFFFITAPISIFKKIKKAWKWNPTGEL